MRNSNVPNIVIMRLRNLHLLVEFGRVIRFGIVGLCATLVYVVGTVIAAEVFTDHPVTASIIGQVASTGISYFGHSSFSFQVKANHRKFLWRFLVIASLAFALNAAVTWLIANAAGLSPRIAIATLTVLIPAFNYLLNRLWVFALGIQPAALARRTNKERRFDVSPI